MMGFVFGAIFSLFSISHVEAAPSYCSAFLGYLARSMAYAFDEHEMPVLATDDKNTHHGIVFGLEHPYDAKLIEKARALAQQADQVVRNVMDRIRDLSRRKTQTHANLTPEELSELEELQTTAGYFSLIPQFYREMVEAMKNPDGAEYVVYQGLYPQTFDSKKIKLARIRNKPDNESLDDRRAEAAGVPKFSGADSLAAAEKWGQEHRGDEQLIRRVMDLVEIFSKRMESAQATLADEVTKNSGKTLEATGRNRLEYLTERGRSFNREAEYFTSMLIGLLPSGPSHPK